jgi:hypothetical protein
MFPPIATVDTERLIEHHTLSPGLSGFDVFNGE